MSTSSFGGTGRSPERRTAAADTVLRRVSPGFLTPGQPQMLPDQNDRGRSKSRGKSKHGDAESMSIASSPHAVTSSCTPAGSVNS
jgi:hypothetical protein